MANDLAREARAAGALAAVVLLGLLAAHAGTFGAPLYESLDIAANSLLLQEAKRGELRTGIYSRWGFHHPGPAFLYVFAAGELVFHDILGWVRSPVTGQIIGLCILSALWLGLLAWILMRTFASVALGIAATATFAAATLLRDHQVFTSLWFPYVHYLPFAVLTASLGRLAQGSLDAVPWLCLSAGMLVHAHVSFVAMTGFMTLGAIVGYWLAAVRAREHWRAHLSRVAREQRTSLIASALILFLLIASLGWSQVPKYIAQGVGHGHPWIASLSYLGQFWGTTTGLLPLACGMVAMAVLLFYPRARGLAYAVALATVATLLFVKLVADELYWVFLGLHYTAATALIPAAFAAWVLDSVFRARAPAIWFATGAAALAGVTAAKPAEVWHDPTVLVITEHLRALPGPVVLDLDNTHDWQRLWGKVVGAAAHWTRTDGRVACIRVGWHLLFTERLRCRDQESRGGSALFVTARPVARSPGDGVVMVDRIAFVPLAPRAVHQGETLMFTAASDHEARRHLREGWSREAEFAWSMGPRATLEMRIADSGPFRVEFDVGAFVPTQQSRQRVTVHANGRVVGTLEFTAERNREARVVEVPAGIAGPDGLVKFELLVERPVSPAALGLSGDTRALGIMLRSARVLP